MPSELDNVTSVLVKKVVGHRAWHGAPQPSMFRARRAQNIEGFSLSRIHVITRLLSGKGKLAFEDFFIRGKIDLPQVSARR